MHLSIAAFLACTENGYQEAVLKSGRDMQLLSVAQRNDTPQFLTATPQLSSNTLLPLSCKHNALLDISGKH